MFRGDGGKNTKPTMSAPASSATSRASGVARPQIFTVSDIKVPGPGAQFLQRLASIAGVLHPRARFVLRTVLRAQFLMQRRAQLQPLRRLGRFRNTRGGGRSPLQRFQLATQPIGFAFPPAWRTPPPSVPAAR